MAESRKSRRQRIAAAALFALAPALAQADAVRHCGLMMASSLAMQFDDAGRPLVPAAIDGRPAAMLVDTGGSYSMISTESARARGLRLAPIDPGIFYMGWSGQTLSQTATAKSLAVGRVTFARPEFLVLPAGFSDQAIAGSLAPDFLHRFDVEFDFARRRFDLYSRAHCEGNVVYWTRQYAVLPFRNDMRWLSDSAMLPSNGFDIDHIVLDAVLDGKPVKVLVDTGSATSWMTLETARRLFGLDLRALTRVGSPQGEPLYDYPFETLDLGNVSVHSPTIVLKADRLEDPNAPDLYLGMTVLGKLHLYIAYGEKKVYVSGAVPPP